MSAVFVHVSDIHFGQERSDQTIIHDDVKQQLIADAKEVISGIDGGTPAGILVTGDIAQSGKKKEYENAGEWLDQLAASIGVEKHCVQMVPGNHDLDRDRLNFSSRKILDHIRKGGVDEFEEILRSTTDTDVLFERFEDYDNFSIAYGCSPLKSNAFNVGLKLELAPNRSIQFIGLNSAVLCYGDKRDNHPEMLIGSRQYTIPGTIGVENIVLVHHPMHWYKDQDSVKQYIHNRARVFISGHEHTPKVSVESVEEGCDVMMLAAGATVAFNSDDEYTFAYNIIEFDWNNEIDGLSVKIHPRIWNPQRTFFEADKNSLDGQDPSFVLNCPFFRDSASQTALTPPKSTADFVDDKSIYVKVASTETVVAGYVTEEPQDMQSELEGYGAVQLRFFRDLFEVERVKILVELDALPAESDERITQGLERKLLQKLVREGQIQKVEDMINQFIDERRDEV